MSVIIFHASYLLRESPQWLIFVASRGWMGVDLFFVLSGFLIGTQVFQFQTQHSTVQQCQIFWIKRWTRTVPMYFFILFIYTVIKPYLFHAPFASGLSWKWFFFLQNYGEIKDFGQSWSLCIEEQFYLVFPVLALLLGPRFPRILWVLPFTISLSLRAWKALTFPGGEAAISQLMPVDYLHLFRFPTFLMLDSISFGVFLAATHDTWSHWSNRIKISISVFGFIILLYAIFDFTEFPTSPGKISALYALLAIAFGCLLIGFKSRVAPIKGIGFLQPIALWSYSAYLWHPLVLRFFERFLSKFYWPIQLGLSISCVLFVSWITYSQIEKRGLKLRNRLTSFVLKEKISNT